MPTYEYVCKSCGEPLEVVQAFTDAALTTCPACGGELRKVFGNVGIVFKGSGFYKTDSRAAMNGASGPSSGDSGGEKPRADHTAESKDGSQKADAKEAPAAGSGPSPAKEGGGGTTPASPSPASPSPSPAASAKAASTS